MDNIDQTENAECNIDNKTYPNNEHYYENSGNSSIEISVNENNTQFTSSEYAGDIVENDVNEAEDHALTGICEANKPNTCTTAVNTYILRSELHIAQSNFIQELQEVGLFVRQVRGDGACLFRSISFQAFGTEAKHHVIRRTIMDYIALNQEMFASFITNETFEAYVNRKRKRTTYGNHIEFQAVANVFQRCVEIYDHRRGSIVPIIIPPPQCNNLGRPFRVLYNGLHFDALIRHNEEPMIQYPTPMRIYIYDQVVENKKSNNPPINCSYNLRHKVITNYVYPFKDDADNKEDECDDINAIQYRPVKRSRKND